MHCQHFWRGRLEQGWLLLPPRLAGRQAPRPRSPAGFVHRAEQMRGEQKKKKKRVMARESKSLGP